MKQIGTSTKKTRGLALKTIDLRDAILEAFDDVDKPVTVRQMFYRLSVAGVVAKDDKKGYRPVQRQLVRMRRENLIPYHWIADNTRWMRKTRSYDSLSDFLEIQARFYRQNLWRDTCVHVEIWCEKDALAGVLNPVTSNYDVPLMVARGYSSESFAYEAAQTILQIDKPAYIYYVGDFDPSGWQASRDLESRLSGFVFEAFKHRRGPCLPVTFERLAINLDQVEDWNLPTRETKTTDTRCKAFFEEFGKGCPSVELDALHPNTLRSIVQEAIEQHIDEHQLAASMAEERVARESLTELAESWGSAS